MAGNPTPTPLPQRVPINRRAPLAVGAVALAVITLLVWRPWAEPVEQLPATPPASNLVAVASPTPSPALDPTPSRTPDPTPRTTQPPPSPTPFSLSTGEGSGDVSCGYVAGDDGSRLLSRIDVEPPTLTAEPALVATTGKQRVGWRFMVEQNHLDTLFTRAWQPVAHSRRRTSLVAAGEAAAFRPQHVAIEAPQTDPTAVFRVVIAGYWFSGGAVAQSVTFVATRYQMDVAGELLPDGCHARL